MRFVVVGIVCLVLFTALSRQVREGRFTSIDFDVTVKVQDYVAKLEIERFEGVLENIGILASPGFSMVATGVLTVWSFKKRRFVALFIPVAFALMTLAEIYGKSVVHHPAPPFFMLKNPTTIFPEYHVWEEFSYPSGHAARAAFLAIVLFFLLKKRLWKGITLGIYVGLIALSRIYLGHHWLSDIIGGVILGSALGFLAYFPQKKLPTGVNSPSRTPDPL